MLKKLNLFEKESETSPLEKVKYEMKYSLEVNVNALCSNPTVNRTYIEAIINNLKEFVRELNNKFDIDRLTKISELINHIMVLSLKIEDKEELTGNELEVHLRSTQETIDCIEPKGNKEIAKTALEIQEILYKIKTGSPVNSFNIGCIVGSLKILIKNRLISENKSALIECNIEELKALCSNKLVAIGREPVIQCLDDIIKIIQIKE